MTQSEARTQFTALVAREEADLELDRAALLIAAEEYPRLEPADYLAQLADFAALAQAHDDADAVPVTRLLRLNDVLCGKLGFRGNLEHYYDARNSFLNDVIDRRKGIPITLSIIYIEVARRLGLPLVGVGMPGHFIVKYGDEYEAILLDPFNDGRLLTVDDCRALIGELYGGELEFQPSFLGPVTKRQMLQRMLHNLKGVYARANAHPKTLGVIERGLLIAPDDPTEMRDRGLINFALGRDGRALSDLRNYLRVAPEAEDAAAIKERIAELRRRQARLN